ncbi:hypothetical protein GCM10020000_33460 [Streptomyces olivoverticillatus]
MRYALPAGLIAGLATFGVYVLARGYYSGGRCARGADECGDADAVPRLDLGAGDHCAAVYMVAGGAGAGDGGAGFLVVLAIPWLQQFFALKLVGTTLPWAAVGIAVVAGVVLEFAWRWVGRKFPA